MAIDMNVLLLYWKDRIEKDLTPFIDPGTILRLSTRGRVLQAEWQQRGKTLDAAFNISIESGAQVSFNGHSLGYRSFYASPEMADLSSLAKMILQARPPQLYVDTKAKRFDVEAPERGPAIAMLQNVISLGRSSDEATLVIIVTGEAGAGKTSVLQQFVRQRSDDYLRGKTESLLLYINAQGRALARFNEALATELQDLRAILTYHAISTLVRLGLIVPVIDGFDELLGVGGYEDAFSSLASFIEELDGQGQLIASARSTYYEQEFVDRANRVSGLGAQVWRQVPIQVLAWGDEEFSDYVNQRCSLAIGLEIDPTALKGKVASVFRGRNESLRAKPLFIARTVDLLLSGAELKGTDDLLEELVNAYIERERTEKLLDRSGGYLLTSAQILSLLNSLSEEMWNQETRELDRRSAKEVAEYVLVTNDVAESTQRVVIERLPSMAFLSTGQKPGSVTFEHETFFSFFLAQRFHSMLIETESPPSLLLGRSVLPEDVASITVELIKRDNASQKPIQAILNRLGAAGSVPASRMAQVRENSGILTEVLLKELCKERGCAGLRLWNIVLPGGDLHGVSING
jgi:predicted transcriptional regulator